MITVGLNLPAGTKVKNLREARGISQLDMAMDLGYYGSASVSRIERNIGSFTKEHAQMFSRYFKVPESIFEIVERKGK